MFPTFCLLHSVTPTYAAGKRARHICTTWRCRKPAADRKTKCETCRSRLYRLKHPIHYAYDNLRSSARKRGIGFELTFAEFEQFNEVTGYVIHVGREPGSLTIDRIFNDLPYRLSNIRIMSYADNTSHRYEAQSAQAADF